MNNRYTLASTTTEHCRSGSMYRGFYPIYDELLADFTITTNNICEIGIGYANPQIIWKYIFGDDSTIVGVDIGAPVWELVGNEDDRLRYDINLVGLKQYIETPIKYTKNVNLLWNRDGYDPETVQEIVDAYGLFDWVVNDGYQRGESFKLMEPWKSAVTDTGVIIQEKMGREPENKINQMRLQQAIDENWLVYDIGEYTELDDQNDAGCATNEGHIGIWSKNQDAIREKLSKFEHLLLTSTDHFAPDSIANTYRKTKYD